MTGRWNKNKTRKPLETSLGQAPKEADKVVDLSHLRKPISTNIFGLKQVLSLFQTATHEVQDYITYECDVLYECRICRTIFRSLANFILHKRNYCREKFSSLGGSHPEALGGFVIDDSGNKAPEEVETSNVQKQNEDGDSNTSNTSNTIQEVEEATNKNDAKKTIMPIIDKLVKKQEVNILAKNTLNEDLSNKADNSDDDVVFVSEETNMVLQKIDTSNAAVFQTAVNDTQVLKRSTGLMKSEVMEIHGIFDNNEVVLGSNGKVCNFETNKKTFKLNIPKQDLVCTECKFTFSTEKTLTHHIKYKHNKTCIVYPCPDCKETFANAWSVYRHLYKVHRRTSSQVRRMRAQIHSSGIRKDQEPERKKDKTQMNLKESEENQWMNNFEADKDLQMCGGCGKRFERKAALHSHSQMCTKRIAVCNTIKENNLKTKCTEKTKDKIEKPEGVKVVKGAAKRKPNSMFVHKIVAHIESSNNEEGVSRNEMEDGTSNKNSVNVLEKVIDIEEDCIDRETGKNTNKETKCEQRLRNAVDTPISIDVKMSDEKEKNDKPTPVVETNVLKVSEVVSDSDDEKENTLEKLADKPIVKNNLESDVTITKYKEAQNEEFYKLQKSLPEIEIFTISDDSSDGSDGSKKTVKSTSKLESVEISKVLSKPTKSLKRKRGVSLELDSKTMKIAEEFKEYLNDELDHCFFAKAVPYIDKSELKCIPCQTTYLSQYQLLWHMSLHFSWFRFQCSKCSFMSFNKYDCTTHAAALHGTPNNLMGSTVLPIPKWKVLLSAHNFTELTEQMVNNNMMKPIEVDNHSKNEEKDPKLPDDFNTQMPCLEAVKDSITNSCKNDVSQNGTSSSETIVLEDDEMPDICHDSAQVADTVILSDDDTRENNAAKENKNCERPGPSKVKESIAINRPIRNRTKSVKTVQNDFIYDLAKVLKLNDNSIKGNRFKKHLSKTMKD